MYDIQDFMRIYYGVTLTVPFTLKDFTEWKDKNYFDEWDYPLEEYDHITQMKEATKEEGLPAITHIPVRFPNENGSFEYRFCEVDKEIWDRMNK